MSNDLTKPQNQAEIFIVDDVRDNIILLSAMLSKKGYVVRQATDGQTALDAAYAKPPSLFLLDIMMPGMNGFELAQHLKADKRTRDIPIIFVSALNQVVDKVKGFSAGGVDYITKPFHADEVLARIETHLTARQLQIDLQQQNKALHEENLRRLRVQEALKDSRQRYRLLAENSTDMISRQSMAGAYLYASPACRTLYGQQVEEVIGSSVFDFCHPEDLPALKALYDAEQDWPAGFTITYRIRHAEHEYIWMETVSKVIPDTDTGRPMEIIAVSRDVTERKQLEEELRAQNQELDAYAHMVAHDLKNPLGAMLSYITLFLDNVSRLELTRVLKFLQSARETGQQMVSIIDSLLLLAKVRRGEVETTPLDMADIVDKAQRRLDLVFKQYEGEIILPESWPSASGYAPWIEEVWANYLSNGLKYGGKPPQLELGASSRRDGSIRFWIKDNGDGLAPEIQASLFTEFTRLDEIRAEGHGLGLSIVRRIIERLGGKVGVESENVAGQGSLFYFTLPKSNDNGTG